MLSLPLTLRLNRDYAYHLVGLDRVGDRPCFLVAFDPVDPARSLYKGRVWIDTERYARLKLQAVQTRLAAPVVSNEEVQTFEPGAPVGETPVYLFTKLVSRQIMSIAGRNLLVEKQVVFSEFSVNDASFDSRREQARRSDDLMYRETDVGLRHLVKRGGERVVSDQATTGAKALVAGVTIDPSYDTPIPLFGIDYLSFDFLGRGLQFGFMFSGVLGAGNLQKTNLWGTKLDVSADFYGVAVKSNDQVYDAEGERKDERLQTRNASTGVNLGYQLTAFQKVTVNVHVQYDQYTASRGQHRRLVHAAGQHLHHERRVQLRVPPRRLLAALQLDTVPSGPVGALGGGPVRVRPVHADLRQVQRGRDQGLPSLAVQQDPPERGLLRR